MGAPKQTWHCCHACIDHILAMLVILWKEAILFLP